MDVVDVFLVSVDGVVFTEEEASVRRAVDWLLSRGVNKILVLSHAGYAADKRIAQRVEGVDVVIGGQSFTLLYNGKDRCK